MITSPLPRAREEEGVGEGVYKQFTVNFRIISILELSRRNFIVKEHVNLSKRVLGAEKICASVKEQGLIIRTSENSEDDRGSVGCGEGEGSGGNGNITVDTGTLPCQVKFET